MKIRDTRKQLQLYLNEDHRHEGRELASYLVDRLFAMEISGCTVVRSEEGYGQNYRIRRPRGPFSLFENRAVVITVIDTAEKIERVIDLLDECVPGGVVTVQDVEFIRYTSSVVTEEDERIADSSHGSLPEHEELPDDLAGGH